MRRGAANQGFYFYANSYSTGMFVPDVQNTITCKVSKDGAPAEALQDVNPLYIGYGVYWFDLTLAESNGNSLAFLLESSDMDVVIDPVFIETV